MQPDKSVYHAVGAMLLEGRRSNIPEKQVQKTNRLKMSEEKPDCYYHLIDYRNNNEVLKKSVMTSVLARQKNGVLSGTGLAWARVK